MKSGHASDVMNCLCANLRMASRAVSLAYDDALRPCNLKATQFTLLATLAKAGELPLTRLADLLVMDRTTLTRNLQPLILRGLIKDATVDDLRVRSIGLTPEGERVYAAAHANWQTVQKRLVEKIGQDKWPAFISDLRSAVAAVKSSG